MTWNSMTQDGGVPVVASLPLIMFPVCVVLLRVYPTAGMDVPALPSPTQPMSLDLFGDLEMDLLPSWVEGEVERRSQWAWVELEVLCGRTPVPELWEGRRDQK